MRRRVHLPLSLHPLSPLPPPLLPLPLSPLPRFVVIHGSSLDASSHDKWAHWAPNITLVLTDPPYCLLERRRPKGDLREASGSGRSGSRSRRTSTLPVQTRFTSLKQYENFTHTWMRGVAEKVAERGERERERLIVIVFTNHLGVDPILHSAARLGYSTLIDKVEWIKPSVRTKSPLRSLLYPISAEDYCAIAKASSSSSSSELKFVCHECALVMVHPTHPLAQTFVHAKTKTETKKTNTCVVHDSDGNGDSDSVQSNDSEHQHQHPYAKPRALLAPLIEKYSNEGDWVLDLFAGSGSVGRSCLALNRTCISIESNAQFAQECYTRFDQLSREFSSPN